MQSVSRLLHIVDSTPQVRRVAGGHYCPQAPSERYVSLSSSYRSSLSNAPLGQRDTGSPRINPGYAVAYGRSDAKEPGWLHDACLLYSSKLGDGYAIP